MTLQERIFILALVINGIIAVVYGILGLRNNSHRSGRVQRLIKMVIMLFCPIASTLFFAVGYVIFVLFMHREVDLEDVVFSKERTRMLVPADEENEKNLAPLQEAIAISDTASLRRLMLHVLKRDMEQSLSAISLALNSEDSETSHYAASVLRDELNDFRIRTQRMRQEVAESQLDTPEERARAELLLTYLNRVLSQRVFTDLEQASYVAVMDEVGQRLYDAEHSAVSPEMMEEIGQRLLEAGEIAAAQRWCDHAMEQYPWLSAAYRMPIRLAFEKRDRKKFFYYLDRLRQSDVVIDKETLDLIRVFQNGGA